MGVKTPHSMVMGIAFFSCRVITENMRRGKLKIIYFLYQSIYIDKRLNMIEITTKMAKDHFSTQFQQNLKEVLR